MDQTSALTPGRVSKILWHFTGGPTWSKRLKRQGSRPKRSSEAYANLVSILRSRELRLGEYREVVRVVLPEHLITGGGACVAR